MLYSTRPKCFLLAFLLLATARCVASTLEAFDLPQPQDRAIFQDMIIDEGGLPWVISNRQVYTLDGEQFRAFGYFELKADRYITRFFGGPDRGAYLAQPGESDHEGKLYRLKDGKYELATTFYYDSGHQEPGIYISKNGTLFNWGQRFLAVFDGQKWRRVEAQFGDRSGLFQPTICDLGDDVFFYSNHDNNVYHCDSANQITITKGPAKVAEEIAVRKRQLRHFDRIISSTWNRDQILVLLPRPLRAIAFDVRTKETSELQIPKEFKDRLWGNDAFETSDGSTWIFASPYGSIESSFYELSTTGQLRILSPTRGLSWSSTRRQQFPNCILEMPDGLMMLGLKENGIAIYHKGKITRLDWRHGLSSGIMSMNRGLSGEIWMSYDRSGSKVARLTLDSQPLPTIDVADQWKEYEIARGSRLWRLEGGTIAMFDAAKPNQLRRISEKGVTHQKMPFAMNRIYYSLVDNRNHLFVTIHPGKTFEITPKDIYEYKGMKQAVVAATKSGATHFRASPEFGGVMLDEQNRLWYSYRSRSFVELFENDSWSAFRFRDNVNYLLESSNDHPLMRTQGGKLFRYNTGQIEELPVSLYRRKDLMLGPKRLRPFDKAIAEKYPRQYFPVLQDRNGKRLYFDIATFEQALEFPEASSAETESVELPFNFDYVIPAGGQGGWLLMSQGSGPPYRIIDQQLIKADFTGTPLADKSIRDIVETPDGDLWFHTYFANGPRVFRLLQSQLSLKSAPTPKVCGRELPVSVAVKPERLASAVEVAPIVNGKRQQNAETNEGEVCFRFPKSGTYHCSIRGMRLGGILPNPVEFAVHASVALPETVWNAPSTEVTFTGLDWQPPIQAVPTERHCQVELEYRIDQGSWQPVDEGAMICLIDQLPGQYSIEFRSIENEFWHDHTPILVKLAYAPDYKWIVNDLTIQIVEGESKVSRRATQQLLKLGSKAMPHLDQKINEAEQADKALPLLRSLRSQIQRAN